MASRHICQWTAWILLVCFIQSVTAKAPEPKAKEVADPRLQRKGLVRLVCLRPSVAQFPRLLLQLRDWPLLQSHHSLTYSDICWNTYVENRRPLANSWCFMSSSNSSSKSVSYSGKKHQTSNWKKVFHLNRDQRSNNGIASANCPERRRARDSSSFAARRDVARPSKMNLHIGSTYGRNATHRAIQVVRLQSAGQLTSLLWRSLGTQIILILNWLRSNRKNWRRRWGRKSRIMRMKRLRSFGKLKGKRRSPRVSGLDRQIQKMMTRSARQPRRLGLLWRVWDRLVRKTPDIPEIPDGESLVAFLEDKKAEKAAKEEKVLAEESAASKRKSGVTEAGKRMLDQTLDEIVVDIKEEVPPSQRNALFGLPESPTSPAGAPAEESAGVESAPTAPTIPSTGIPISAVTEQDVPKDHDSKLETCKACAGSGRADPDMNEAIQVLLDAQKASMASVSQEVKKEDSPKGKDADSQDKDDRLGAFTFCEGVATDFCIVELCCNRFSELSRAAKVLGCSHLGVHDQLEVPSTCQQVLKTLRLAIAEGKKVEGKKVGRVYCHCSLPCTGGSPLLNFSDASIRERHQAKFLELLSCLTEYWEGIRRIDPQSLFSFELPHQNRYWKLADMRNFRTQWGLDFYGIVSGCRTGLMIDRGVPIGKRYRIITNHQEIAQRIHARFSQCVCTCDHASFNEIDWHDTERYTKRFAITMQMYADFGGFPL